MCVLPAVIQELLGDVLPEYNEASASEESRAVYAQLDQVMPPPLLWACVRVNTLPLAPLIPSSPRMHHHHAFATAHQVDGGAQAAAVPVVFAGALLASFAAVALTAQPDALALPPLPLPASDFIAAAGAQFRYCLYHCFCPPLLPSVTQSA